jgi:hypothetical protein
VGCFEARNDVRGVVRAASAGLEHHPQSEVLWNVKAYNQIRLGEHEAAEATLRTALETVTPTDGTMENNLAWAGLWTQMEMKEAKTLYVAALEKTPQSCEMIHTGLYIEFKIAQSDDRYERFWGLKNYKKLRKQYANNRCEDRIQNGEWTTLAEVAGVGLLDEEVEKMSGRADATANDTLYETGAKLREKFMGASLDSFCGEAMPPSHSSVNCNEQLLDTLDEVRGWETPRERYVDRKRNNDCILPR